MSDGYKTITQTSQGIYKAKMSKFISFAIPVDNEDDAKATIKVYQNKYHDARHCCWAYMLGPNHDRFLCNDNGEPSGTAGRPILGQIRSFQLTNVLVCVVRYFGGIKLGTPGLIEAYKTAAFEALNSATIVECREKRQISFTFPYLSMQGIMKIIKSSDVKLLSQDFDNSCSMTIECNLDDFEQLSAQLVKVDGCKITSGEQV